MGQQFKPLFNKNDTNKFFKKKKQTRTTQLQEIKQGEALEWLKIEQSVSKCQLENPYDRFCN